MQNKISLEDTLIEIFKSFPSSLTVVDLCFKHVELNNLQLKASLEDILAQNFSITKCCLREIYTSVCWDFIEITERNKKLKQEQRFKLMKVAPPAAGEHSLGKRKSLDSESNPNKKQKLK